MISQTNVYLEPWHELIVVDDGSSEVSNVMESRQGNVRLSLNDCISLVRDEYGLIRAK
jgi:hypothetical protein